MFSGWGVRTLADGQPVYNPIEYHNGTVWPHDTALIAAGLARYGRRQEANRLAVALLEAAGHFAFRLPEAFAGYPRSQTRVPVEYPERLLAAGVGSRRAAAAACGSCSAWSRRPTRLTVRPHLPAETNRLRAAGHTRPVGPSRRGRRAGVASTRDGPQWFWSRSVLAARSSRLGLLGGGWSSGPTAVADGPYQPLRHRWQADAEVGRGLVQVPQRLLGRAAALGHDDADGALDGRVADR